MDMHILSEAVEAKLGGLVIDQSDNKLLVKRNRPTWDDKAFMTICKMHTKEHGFSFYWGHYDMTLGQALKSLNER